MDLAEIYEKGERFFRDKEYGLFLEYVETGFIRENDRRIIDRFTFRQKSIDAPKPRTTCRVLDVELSTPVIMSSMTMPIPAIADGALLQLARGLKAAGSLMWTGTPIPQNLREIVDTGVPVVANVKPFTDRDKIQETLEKLISDGVTWVGLEIDAGQGTKVRDREMGFDCTPFTLQDIEAIKKRASVPLVCKGVLSPEDAQKCIDAGVDILFVSNHGGHTLDYLPHPFQVMEEILEVARGKAEVIADGGIRRGSDVLKALAFGASLVGLGRPILYGLASGGEQGIVDLIAGITRELARLMSMVGVSETNNVPGSILIER